MLTMKYWLGKLLATDGACSSLVLRLALAVVIFPHGAQKVLGWFGGHGFSATLEAFTGKMGLPFLIALLVIAGEFFGSLALAAGLFTRLAAAGITAIMLGAVATAHWHNGFFMNWSGQQAGEGFEFHILAMGMGLALILTGGGLGSLDGEIEKRL